MTQSYSRYYEDCRRAWPGSADALTVYRLGVRVIDPAQPAADDLIRLPDGYDGIIARLARDVARRIEAGVGLYRNSDPAAGKLAIQLNDFWDLDGLEALAAIVVPQLEQRVFGCHAVINQVGVIRSVPCRAAAVSSWLWHYDNNAAEAFKLLVYLVDVEPGRGAFEYIERLGQGSAVRIETSRLVAGEKHAPLWPKSRIPAATVERWLGAGMRIRSVVGPRGTMIVFDANCVHRATIPADGHRDAVIFSLRPCERAVRPFLAPGHTGSWGINAKSWDPACPLPRTPAVRAGRGEKAA